MSSSMSRSGVAVDAPQNSPPTAGESSTLAPGVALAGVALGVAFGVAFGVAPAGV